MESVVVNHPFNDGNKRISYYLMRATLLHFNLDVNATEDEKYNFVIGVASGKLKYEQIVEWIKNNIC